MAHGITLVLHAESCALEGSLFFPFVVPVVVIRLDAATRRRSSRRHGRSTSSTMTVKAERIWPEPRSLSMPISVRFEAVGAGGHFFELADVDRHMTLRREGSRLKPCIPQCFGMYLMRVMTRCLFIPALPRPPRFPAPRPAFFSTTVVRLRPRCLFAFVPILFTSDHSVDQVADGVATGAEGSSVDVRTLDAAPALRPAGGWRRKTRFSWERPSPCLRPR